MKDAKPQFPLDPEEFRRRLGVMHASYRAKMPDKIAEIEALWRRVATGLPGDEAREALLMATHTLTGSAPTLGCEALGVAARDLEAALRIAYAHEGPMSAGEIAAIGRLAAKLGPSLG